MAVQLRENTHAVTEVVQNSPLDFAALEALAAALGDVSHGLEGWAAALDGDRLRTLGESLSRAADSLDQALAGAAGKIGDGPDAPPGRSDQEARGPVMPIQPAEALTALGGPFAEVLRDPDTVRQASASLRQVRKLVDGAGSRWPQVATSMTRSAAFLSGAEKQLQTALGQREQYERAIRNTTELAKVSSDLLPVMTDRLDARLGQQELSLERMSRGLNDVHDSLPEIERSAGTMIGTFRWLLWLVAGLVSLHGAFVVVTNFPPRRTAV